MASNHINRLEQHTLIWLKGGFGKYEVDFETYAYTSETILFLEPGQYFKVTGGDLRTESLPVTHWRAPVSHYRYLFKHLVAVGHIKPQIKLHAAHDLRLDEYLDTWKQQDPFNATPDELNLLFDLNEHVSRFARKTATVGEILAEAKLPPGLAQHVVKSKLHLTLKDLALRQRLLEAQRELIFTLKPIKEIAYGLGFDDPAYFSRFFYQRKNVTPEIFRDRFDIRTKQQVVPDLLALVDKYYRTEHRASFYADQLFMSQRTLARKVQAEISMSVKDLINKKLIAEGTDLLSCGMPVKEVAYYLGFKEPQHFSTFYKLQAGHIPSQVHL